MTRQEAVIKIAKINRIVGEWKYRLDVNGKVEYDTLSSDLPHIGEWTKEIYLYLEQNPSPLLIRQIDNIGFTDLLEHYVQEHRGEIEASYLKALDSYVTHMRALVLLCNKQKENQKGSYTEFPGPLANERVATLLQRAVDTGILDSHYQPLPHIKTIQLKIIAFAISTICGFRHPYTYFEKLWKRENGNRISTTHTPKRNTGYLDATKALYPEVDFTALEQKHESETFYTPQSDEDREKLYRDLLKGGYIASKTTLKIFSGIFDKEKFRQPVEWIKDQRQLAYFIHLAFSKYNRRHLWVKGECCFRINGAIPHRQCLITGYSWINRAGWMDKYDMRLKEICETFNHAECKTATEKKSKERPIHNGTVFHSSRSERDRKRMYLALAKGGYIDPETTFAVFKGIFDVTKFKGAVKWMKPQGQLMYFVYLAFKTDNPFDLWKKCAACFRLLNGAAPNQQSLNCNFRFIKKNGLLATYNTELKRIADKYNGISENANMKITDNGQNKQNPNNL